MTVLATVKIVGVLILVGAVIGGLGLRVAILRYLRAHPHLRKPIDPAEDRRKAKPWIVSQVISAVLVVPLMVTTHGAANVVFATGVIFWLLLTPVLRLVGYLAGRARRLL
jgi:pheromone shutdown protein TraB